MLMGIKLMPILMFHNRACSGLSQLIWQVVVMKSPPEKSTTVWVGDKALALTVMESLTGLM